MMLYVVFLATLVQANALRYRYDGPRDFNIGNFGPSNPEPLSDLISQFNIEVPKMDPDMKNQVNKYLEKINIRDHLKQLSQGTETRDDAWKTMMADMNAAVQKDIDFAKMQEELKNKFADGRNRFQQFRGRYITNSE